MISIENINYYKPHWHDTILEFSTVLAGSIDVTAGPDSYRMRENDILLTEAGKVHSFQSTNEENLVLFIRVNSADWMNEFPGIMEWELTADPATAETNSEIFNSLRTYMHEAALDFIRLGECTESLESMRRLLRFCRDRFLPSGIMMHDENVNEVQIETFMKLNSFIKRSGNSPTIIEASEFINYSRNHTAYIVKQMTGLTFTDFLKYNRCLDAEKLLLSTEKTISEIADECGFTDLQDFTSTFKKRYHNDPGNYRNILNSNYPEGKPVSTDPIDMSTPKVLNILKQGETTDNSIYTLNLSEIPAGIVYKHPQFGIPDSYTNNDGIDNLSVFIENILSGLTATVKQTDDRGTSIFNGDCGLVTYNGISKAVFHVYDFLSPLRYIQKNESGYLIGSFGNSVRLLLYPSVSSGNRIKVKFNTAGIDYTVKKYRIDNRHGNPYYFWDKLGQPSVPAKEDVEMIIRHSQPELDISLLLNRTSFNIEELLPEVGAVLIDISPVPVSDIDQLPNR